MNMKNTASNYFRILSTITAALIIVLISGCDEISQQESDAIHKSHNKSSEPTDKSTENQVLSPAVVEGHNELSSENTLNTQAESNNTDPYLSKTEEDLTKTNTDSGNSETPDLITPDNSDFSDALATLESDPEGMTLNKHLIATGVNDRIPVSPSDHFSTDVGRVYCYINVNNHKKQPRKINTVWVYEGKEIHRYQLKVGSSKSWRTWSRLTIKPQKSGNWRCDIENEDGLVISSTPFKIETSQI